MNLLKEEFFTHLKRDESLFSFLLDHSLDGIWFWNLENKEEGWMNDKFWLTLGYDPASHPHWKEVLFEEDQGAVAIAFRKHLEDQSEYFETTLRYKHALGKVSWFRCRGKSVRNQEGVPIRLFGSNIDITKIKEKEIESEILLSRLSSILMNVGDLVFLLNKEYVFQKLKQYDSEDHLVNQDEYMGKSIHDLPFEAETKNKIIQAIDNTFLKKEKTYADYSIPFPDGERYFHLLVSPVIDEDEKVKEVLAVARNVTETFHLQSALEEGNKIFISGPMVAFRWSFSGRWPVQYVSPNVEKLTGYSEKEFQTEKIKLLDLIHPKDRERVELEMFLYLKQQLPFFTQEYRIIKKDSTSISIIDYSTPIYDENGSPKTILGYIQDNSDRKNFEDQILKQRNEIQRVHKRLEDTNRVAHVGGWDVDLIHNTLWWSKETKDLYGMEQSYHPSLDEAMELIKEGENKEYFIRTFENSIEKGDPYDIEIEILTVSGESKWVRAIGNPEFVNGQCVRIHGALQDINQRKIDSQEKALKEEQFQKAFHCSVFGMAIISLSGQFEEVNKSLCNMLGYSETEMLNLQFQKLTHPEDLPKNLHYREELLAGRIDSYDEEKRYIHKNGNIIHALLSVALIKTIDGKPHHFVAQVENITERVRSNQITKETIANLQSILDASTQVSIISTDSSGTITNFNRGAETLLGYSASEMVGKKSTVSIHKEDEILRRGIELSQEFGREISGFDTFVTYAKLGKYDSREWSFVKKDGSSFPVQSVITAIRDPESNIIGFLEISTDISDRKNMERTVIEAKLKAEAANHSKSEFLANMSHEIRTPLNGVIGFTDLLLRTKLDEVQMEYMSTVYQSATSLLDLLNDVLDFSKIEAGKMEINIEKVDLFELAGQIADMVKYRANEKGLELLLNIDAGTPRFIWTDPIRLRQVLVNLVGNAVKFTHVGEIEIKIECLNPSIQNQRKIFQFLVRDTGIGVTSSNRKKIFEAFEQEDASTTRRYGGTGLGLSISNKLLSLMNSYLEVESETGKGSSFFFNLEVESESGEPILLEEPIPVKKALIVDDNQKNLTILKGMLVHKNIEVELASNGIEALEKISKNKDFDVILVDHHMPYLDGLDVIRNIRTKMGLSVEIQPIIFLHNFASESELEKEFTDLEINFKINKPVKIEQLYIILAQIRKNNSGKKIPVEELQKPLQKENESCNPTVMIVEDNNVNMLLCKTMIQKCIPKANIIEAVNGLEAVEKFKLYLPNLIFMDIQMPEMNGYDATRKIRETEKGKSVPIIAVTAGTLKGEEDRCLEAGMNDYISKPVVLLTLKDQIHKWLKKTTQTS